MRSYFFRGDYVLKAIFNPISRPPIPFIIILITGSRKMHARTVHTRCLGIVRYIPSERLGVI